MILTVTMNPSVDISYTLPNFKTDTVNRADSARKTAGGKGLNVARVIKQMGEEVLATGIVGGTLGDFIETTLKKEAIPYDFLKTTHESRNCIAILHDGEQTEILESGPTLSDEETNDFLLKFATLIQNKKILTISGSLPKGIPPTIYQKMTDMATENGTKIILDCSGALLKQSLAHPEKPFLIKPNQEELSQLLKTEISVEIPDLKKALSQPLFQDIPWIVISLGAKGAFIKVGNDYYQAMIPKVNAINPVGSGDATVAGLAVGILKEKSTEDIIKTAMTTGLLNALEPQTGCINYTNFETYYNQITVTKV